MFVDDNCFSKCELSFLVSTLQLQEYFREVLTLGVERFLLTVMQKSVLEYVRACSWWIGYLLRMLSGSLVKCATSDVIGSIIVRFKRFILNG